MENQPNEQPVNMGKILSGVFAILSCLIVFFFNINVFSFMQYWGNIEAISLISEIIAFLAVIASFAFIIINIVSFVSKEDKRGIFMLVCIIEVAISGLMFLYEMIASIIFVLDGADYLFPVLTFFQLIFCIGLFVGYIVCNKKLPIASATNGTPQTEGQSATVGNAQAGQVDGYYPLMTHVLLMIFVGTIWRFIWIYRANKYLNSRTDFNRSPTTSLLLCIFVPFYGIYWMYKAAQEIDKLGAPYSRDQIATVCLLCEIFFDVATPILMQKKINDIIDAENGGAKTHESHSTANNATVNQPAANTADELKKYKQLLDEGAITQEEYDVIKSEYLKEIINK